MFKCEELNKVAKALDEHGISWKDKSDNSIERIHFQCGNINVSVVNGEFTYGGEYGLLETMPPTNTLKDINTAMDVAMWSTDVQGWLTAEEVIDAWIF